MNFEDFAGPEPPVNDSYHYWWERMRDAWNIVVDKTGYECLLRHKERADNAENELSKECKRADEWREMALGLSMALEYAMEGPDVDTKILKLVLAEYHKLENPCNATDVS